MTWLTQWSLLKEHFLGELLHQMFITYWLHEVTCAIELGRKEKTCYYGASHLPSPIFLLLFNPLACAVFSTISAKPAPARQNGPSFFFNARSSVSFLHPHMLIYTPLSWLTDCPITNHLTSVSPGHSLSPLHSSFPPLWLWRPHFPRGRQSWEIMFFWKGSDCHWNRYVCVITKTVIASHGTCAPGTGKNKEILREEQRAMCVLSSLWHQAETTSHFSHTPLGQINEGSIWTVSI